MDAPAIRISYIKPRRISHCAKSLRALFHHKTAGPAGKENSRQRDKENGKRRKEEEQVKSGFGTSD
jgi:hypothetical protein